MEGIFYNLLMKKKDKPIGLSFVSGNNNVNFKSSDINLGLGDFTVEIYARSEGSTVASLPFFGCDKDNYSIGSFRCCGNSSTKGTNGITSCPVPESPLTGNAWDNQINVNITDNTKNPHHIVITRQRTTMKTYVNGVLKATKEQDRVLDFSNFVYSIANTSLFTLGRVFNFCATQSFVTELWNGGDVINYKLSDIHKEKDNSIFDLTKNVTPASGTWGSIDINNNNGNIIIKTTEEPTGNIRFDAYTIPKYSSGKMYIVKVRAKGNGYLLLSPAWKGYLDHVYGDSATGVMISLDDSDNFKDYCIVYRRSTTLIDKATTIGIAVNVFSCDCEIEYATVSEVGCVLEYLPESIRTDKILDTSGQDNHGIFTGNPKKVYEKDLYTECEYLESTGAPCYIDTGIIPNSNIDWIIKTSFQA